MSDPNSIIRDIRGDLEEIMVKLDELEAELSVDNADVIGRADEDISFAGQGGYTVQVIGTYVPAAKVPETGIHGTTLPNGDTIRFGKVGDPEGSSHGALVFQVVKGDPSTSGGKRTEISFTPNIEVDKTYWAVFGAYVFDWGALGVADNALFGIQMHNGDNTLGLSPSFALYTSKAGRSFRVQARYSISSSPSQGNSVTVNCDEQPIPFGQWVDFAFKFKHNTNSRGFVQAWMNGQMIADHHGNLGYNTSSKDYAKFGYYNWTASAMNNVPRKVLLRTPTLVVDPTGQTYTLEQVRDLV